jgi:transcriptional regulator with XRE-family HTH domain
MLAMNDMKRLGQTVEDAMNARGMAGYELASRIGRQPSWVSRFLNGGVANLPDVDTLERIGHAVGIRMPAMLEAAGYLKPELMDAGDVITVRRDDPRAKLLSAVAGMTDDDVVQFTQAMTFLMKARAKYAPDDIRGGNDDAPGVMSSEGIQRQSNTDSA